MLNRPSNRSLPCPALLMLSLCLAPLARSQTLAASDPQSPTSETVVLPPSVPDPLEPMNRVLWAFNRGLLRGVIQPSGRVYRFVVVKPVRTGISNFGRNLIYPGRLINNLLQGKWRGARDESYRFACNSTVGMAGFLDVATKWKIPKSDADFGQTFGQWGWQPQCFLMLPILGRAFELGHQVEARQRDVEIAAQPGANVVLDQVGAGQHAQPEPQILGVFRGGAGFAVGNDVFRHGGWARVR